MRNFSLKLLCIVITLYDTIRCGRIALYIARRSALAAMFTYHFSRYPNGSILDIAYSITFALSMTAVIYGVTSWCIIKKFRHFKNYVFISANIANMLYFLAWFFMAHPGELLKYSGDLVMFVLFLYTLLLCNSWILVTCYIFYVDFVKVFYYDIRKRCLKSSLFCWGVPSITFFFLYVIPVLLSSYDLLYNYLTPVTLGIYIALALIGIIFFLNCFLCVRVQYTLFRASASIKKLRGALKCSLIFCFSIILPSTALLSKCLNLHVLVILGLLVNATVLNLFLTLRKTNRELWWDFLNKIKPIQILLELM